jgi:20S proteasome alpha/beta subunit
VHQLTDNVAVAIQGFMADANALLKSLRMRIDVSWRWLTGKCDV